MLVKSVKIGSILHKTQDAVGFYENFDMMYVLYGLWLVVSARIKQ